MKIKDIAKLAGVSIATVSRVVNDKPGVRDEVREKVKEVIKEHEYKPNLIARGLSSKKSNIIGLLLPKFTAYYTEQVDAIINYCNQKGYRVMITSSVGRFEGELKNLNMLYKSQVEGILYFVGKMTEEKKENIEKINKEIPVVLLDQAIEELSIPAVLPDNYGGAVKAMNYLVNSGHKKIAFIKAPYYDLEGEKRYRAYQDIMKRNNFEIKEGYVQGSDYSIESGYKAMENILSKSDQMPTAVLASNDGTAIGAINYLREEGIEVPEDISVMGIDDIEIAKHFIPKLTTVKQDLYYVGDEAIKLLFDYIDNKDLKAKKLIVEQELVIRDSVRNLNDKL
ncbi:transcriptional regulator, LacI family [Orenia metallireducens]|uniref:Transcriptional regulator, LacI family n=1 Tax=Orenia metallireducens TaxID=1413210 RepID=A0A285GBM6_9FIRM|nr:LacI family DNA-binding transcriptional regulator [Orenia metallireducens]SNY20723.1 transcriptional regulator, LacI family [Orenia metallireducens]